MVLIPDFAITDPLSFIILRQSDSRYGDVEDILELDASFIQRHVLPVMQNLVAEDES